MAELSKAWQAFAEAGMILTAPKELNSNETTRSGCTYQHYDRHMNGNTIRCAGFDLRSSMVTSGFRELHSLLERARDSYHPGNDLVELLRYCLLPASSHKSPPHTALAISLGH